MANKTHDITIKVLSKTEISMLSAYRLDYLTELLGECSALQREKTGIGLEAYFSEALELGNIYAVIAQEGNKALSFGAMVIKKIPGDFDKPYYLEGDILNMFTIPAARNRGLSSLILEHLIGEARKMGISKLSLHTTKAGEKVYRRAGFSEPKYPVLELTL